MLALEKIPGPVSWQRYQLGIPLCLPSQPCAYSKHCGSRWHSVGRQTRARQHYRRARMAGVAAHRFIHNRIDDLEKQLHALGTDQPVFCGYRKRFQYSGRHGQLGSDGGRMRG